MLFRFIGLFLILITATTSFAQGRKPAVEDFVGIEIDQPELTPQGSEALYNLEQDIKKIETTKGRPALKTTSPSNSVSSIWNLSLLVGISLLLGLPLMLWLLMMGHLKNKASIESASNIEVLEKYRKERENKSEKNIRKVS